MKNVKAVVVDWAGTMVDYGCFAPLQVFKEVFANKGVPITDEEARKPMGLLKRDHIQAILQMERVQEAWQEIHGRYPDEKDTEECYADFEPNLLTILKDYAAPIPGALETVQSLRSRRIKIGSTTGYTSEMMAIVAQEAKKQGYTPDCVVTSSDVPAGRPFPWMIYKNAIQLDIYPMSQIVKVGDTISDIKEGLNASTWTVGVIKGGSELGMREEEVRACPPSELAERMNHVRQRFIEAGAHEVISSIGELEKALTIIEARLEQGELPGKATGNRIPL